MLRWIFFCCFGKKFIRKLKIKNLCENFSSEIMFRRIDPWSAAWSAWCPSAPSPSSASDQKKMKTFARDRTSVTRFEEILPCLGKFRPSVTRFEEILPFWTNFDPVWHAANPTTLCHNTISVNIYNATHRAFYNNKLLPPTLKTL
jgi:hypothetical protein